MQNRYTADIGDYGKLGLLRCLEKTGLKIGVNWYLTPDEGHNEDGRFIQYAHDEAYQPYDPPLWRALAQILENGQRRVTALESPRILKATFFGELLDCSGVPASLRPDLRTAWHRRALKALRGCQLVFADPDNGLMVPSALHSKRSDKYVLPEELFAFYRQGASVLYYQHKARRSDDFYLDQHRRLVQALPKAQGLGLKFTHTSLRYYWFLLQPEHAERVRRCVDQMLTERWSELFQLC